MKPGAIVIYESTVYPGCTEEVCVPILERSSGMRWKQDFHVGYSPERINPGDKERTCLSKILKVVSGDDDETLEKVAALYGSVVKAGVYRGSSIKVAEAAKVIENTQRDLNIAFVNELAIIFERSASTPRGAEGRRHQVELPAVPPGPGRRPLHRRRPVLPDAQGRARRLPPRGDPRRAAHQRRHGRHIARKTVQQMIHAGRNIKGARVNVLGLTFKENVPDIRNSKVIDIIRELHEFGVEAYVHDPLAAAEEALHEYGLRSPWEEPARRRRAGARGGARAASSRCRAQPAKKIVRGGCVIDVKAVLDSDRSPPEGLRGGRGRAASPQLAGAPRPPTPRTGAGRIPPPPRCCCAARRPQPPAPPRSARPRPRLQALADRVHRHPRRRRPGAQRRVRARRAARASRSCSPGMAAAPSICTCARAQVASCAMRHSAPSRSPPAAVARAPAWRGLRALARRALDAAAARAGGVRADPVRIAALLGAQRRARCAHVVCVPNPGVVRFHPAGAALQSRAFSRPHAARQGIFDLLDAIAALRPAVPDVRLVCAGDGNRIAVARYAESLGIADAVKFTGWVGPSGQARCSRRPRRSRFARRGGAAVGLLEAMAAGVPPVACAVGGIPEVVVDGVSGFLVAPGDRSTLERALRRLLIDAKLAERIGAAARETARLRFAPEARAAPA